MSSISGKIERYLIMMLDKTNTGVIEIQRGEVADVFSCVPSQINYVLSTRFTPAHGYIVETRRGGGGFVRIVRVNFKATNDFQLLLNEIIGEEIPQNQGEGLLERLKNEGILTKREAEILKNICSDTFLNSNSNNSTGHPRARIIQMALATVLRKDL